MSETYAAAIAAQAAARAAGHAAATAHMAAHATNYAVKAVTCAAVSTDPAAAKERDWQYRCLPKHLRAVAFTARRR
jgi:hypothetical protein